MFRGVGVVLLDRMLGYPKSVPGPEPGRGGSGGRDDCWLEKEWLEGC